MRQYHQSVKDGLRAEHHYQALLGVEPSTTNENIRKGIDAWIPVDVKAVRRVSRNEDKNENIHWIEIKNVSGKRGWLYKDSVFLVFETNDYWIHVLTSKLRTFIESKVDVNGAPTAEKGIYKLYQRATRKDLLTLMPIADLFYLAEFILPKTYDLKPTDGRSTESDSRTPQANH